MGRSCSCAGQVGFHSESCGQVAEWEALDALIARAAARLTEGAA